MHPDIRLPFQDFKLAPNAGSNPVHFLEKLQVLASHTVGALVWTRVQHQHRLVPSTWWDASGPDEKGAWEGIQRLIYVTFLGINQKQKYKCSWQVRPTICHAHCIQMVRMLIKSNSYIPVEVVCFRLAGSAAFAQHCSTTHTFQGSKSKTLHSTPRFLTPDPRHDDTFVFSAAGRSLKAKRSHIPTWGFVGAYRARRIQ